MVFAGDPAFTPHELLTLGFRGLIEAPTAFEPLLRAAYADLRVWPRVIGTLARADQRQSEFSAALPHQIRY
jgi:hypothetical protein